MTLNEQDSGRTINMEMGKIIIVRLKESPTTGYRWTVETNSSLEQIANHFEEGRAIGSAGVREFKFRPVKIGSYDLRINNRREWEDEGSAIARFAAKIIVK